MYKIAYKIERHMYVIGNLIMFHLIFSGSNVTVTEYVTRSNPFHHENCQLVEK